MKSTFFAAAAMASIPIVLGQTTASITGSAIVPTTTAASETSASTSREPVTMTVKVGVNHDYQPDSVTALPGDVISRWNAMQVKRMV